MIFKETLKQIAEQQKKELQEKELGVRRDVLQKIHLDSSHATIITGIRRCGKSTLLRQLMKKKNSFI